jgi:hypothetical protein
MGGFGTIAIGVISLVLMGVHGVAKVGFGILDAFGNLGKICQLQGCAIGGNNIH